MGLTPEQFNKIVLKEDLKRALAENNEELLMQIRKENNEILTAIDGLAKKVEISEVERLSNISAHDRFQNKLDLHEIRIKKLETEKV